MKTAMLGLLIVFGAVGGVDIAADMVQLVQCTAVACVGLAVMLIGVSNEVSNG